MKRNKFAAGEIYHICNKSIANYAILKDPVNAKRLIQALDYYNNIIQPAVKFSKALKKKSYRFSNLLFPKSDAIVKILAYIVMLDHYHILVKALYDDVISKYINDVENSFTRFFNTRFDRKGPLWQSSFRAVRITSEEQLLHVTRYIHINCTTSDLVKKPEDWEFSSYCDYIDNSEILGSILTEIPSKSPESYKKFCESRIDYQKKLKKIKKLLLE